MSVDARVKTTTVHRYYVEIVESAVCVQCGWEGATEYRDIVKHCEETGHEVRFALVDYCSMKCDGNVIAPAAEDLMELRKRYGDMRRER